MYIEASVPPDCRSARNNLYSGISLVHQVRSLISLLCSVSLCFWSFPVSSFPRFLVFSFPRFLVSSFPHFLVSLFPCFLISSFPRFLVSDSVSFLVPFPCRIPFHFPFRFPFRFTYRILFHDPRFSTDFCSGSRSGFHFHLASLATAPHAASRFAPARRCFI